VELVDARNRRWVFQDKAPMFERVPSQLFTSGAIYPSSADRLHGDCDRGRLWTPNRHDRHRPALGLESVDSQHSFEVTADQLIRKP
jgi:hypothetical protein